VQGSESDSVDCFELREYEVKNSSPVKQGDLDQLAIPESKLKSEETKLDRSTPGLSPTTSFLANISQALSGASDTESPLPLYENSQAPEGGAQLRMNPSVFCRTRAHTQNIDDPFF